MTSQRISLTKGLINHSVQLYTGCIIGLKLNGPCVATDVSHLPVVLQENYMTFNKQSKYDKVGILKIALVALNNCFVCHS